MDIASSIAKVRRQLDPAGGLTDVYLVGCGGSLAAFWPCEFVLQRECTTGLRVSSWNAAQFVQSTPRRLGRNSLVVACSHQGDTPETAAAATLAKSRGAACIALTYTPGSPLTAHADDVISYEWGPGSRVEYQKMAVGLRLAFQLLASLEAWPLYKDAMESLDRIHAIAQGARASVASYAASYIESYCILMEMQWLHTASFHAGEFFHGALEITSPEVPFILLMGTGSTRSLDERALSFVRQYGQKLLVIDSEELGIGGLPPGVAEYVAPLLLMNTIDVFNQELARERQHPLATRRYMWRVKY